MWSSFISSSLGSVGSAGSELDLIGPWDCRYKFVTELRNIHELESEDHRDEEDEEEEEGKKEKEEKQLSARAAAYSAKLNAKWAEIAPSTFGLHDIKAWTEGKNTNRKKNGFFSQLFSLWFFEGIDKAHAYHSHSCKPLKDLPPVIAFAKYFCGL